MRDTRHRLDHAESIQAVLAAPDARSFPLVGEGVSGRLVASPSGPHSVLVTGGLPAVPEGRAYTLWLIRGEQPLAVHQFRVDGEARAVELVAATVEGYHAAGITEEAAAAVLPAAPTGPVLVQADLCADCG